MNTRTWIAMLLAAVLLSGCGTPAMPVADTVGSVAVLVLDEFDPDPPPVTGPPEQNCTYQGSGANVVGSTGAGDGGMPPGRAHGSVVFESARAELNSTPYLTHLTTPPPPISHPRVVPSHVDGWQYRGSRLLLVGVDTGGFNTNTVITNLNGVMQTIKAQYGISRFVVNMSFVIAPCDVSGWLDRHGAPLNASGLQTYYESLIEGDADLESLHTTLDTVVATTRPDQLVTALLTDSDLRPLSERVPVNAFYSLFSGWDIEDIDPFANTLPGDALEQLLNDPMRPYFTAQAVGRVIPVAAAGNGTFTVGINPVRHTPLTFPFAPGMWNNVVSVSASASGAMASYSNSGEVMLNGETPELVHGTSFAAPRLSARQAIYLLAGGPVPCGVEIPPLGYVNYERSLTDELYHPRWLNLSIADAAARSCRDFVAWSTLRP